MTDSTGLALAATEKNASIEGTLAQKISGAEKNIDNIIMGASVTMPAGDVVTISAPGLIDGTAVAVNGDYTAGGVGDIQVVGIQTSAEVLHVKLSRSANGAKIRINYIYRKR